MTTMIHQDAWYLLPDGTRVQATCLSYGWRCSMWLFLDEQGRRLYQEDSYHRGHLNRLVRDTAEGGDWVVPSDLTLADLRSEYAAFQKLREETQP